MPTLQTLQNAGLSEDMAAAVFVAIMNDAVPEVAYRLYQRQGGGWRVEGQFKLPT